MTRDTVMSLCLSIGQTRPPVPALLRVHVRFSVLPLCIAKSFFPLPYSSPAPLPVLPRPALSSFCRLTPFNSLYSRMFSCIFHNPVLSHVTIFSSSSSQSSFLMSSYFFVIPFLPPPDILLQLVLFLFALPRPPPSLPPHLFFLHFL